MLLCASLGGLPGCGAGKVEPPPILGAPPAASVCSVADMQRMMALLEDMSPEMRPNVIVAAMRETCDDAFVHDGILAWIQSLHVGAAEHDTAAAAARACLLYTSPSPRDQRGSRMPSSA